MYTSPMVKFHLCTMCILYFPLKCFAALALHVKTVWEWAFGVCVFFFFLLFIKRKINSFSILIFNLPAHSCLCQLLIYLNLINQKLSLGIGQES